MILAFGSWLRGYHGPGFLPPGSRLAILFVQARALDLLAAWQSNSTVSSGFSSRVMVLLKLRNPPIHGGEHVCPLVLAHRVSFPR